MSSILFIGRFQPFHLGHLWAIRNILKKEDDVLIGIGSAQYSNTRENPFSLEERTEMIQSAGLPKGRYRIIPIPDIHNNLAWPAHVRECAGNDFQEVRTGTPLVKKLFEKVGTVPVIDISERYKNISATKIRQNMVQNDDSWREMVPNAVAALIDRIRGVQRVLQARQANSTDKSSSTAAEAN